jgi:hypothetical protein
MASRAAKWLLWTWPANWLASIGLWIRRRQVDQIFSDAEAKYMRAKTPGFLQMFLRLL